MLSHIETFNQLRLLTAKVMFKTVRKLFQITVLNISIHTVVRRLSTGHETIKGVIEIT